MPAIDSAALPAIQVLEAAASGAKPSAQQVTTALLDAERQAKAERRQFFPEDLLGTWRLRFTAPQKPAYKAGNPQGRGFYLPRVAIATLGFSHDDEGQLTIQNQLQVGPTRLRFTGPAKLLPKKNLLAFDFVRLQVLAGGLTVVNLPLRSKAAKAGDFAATSVAKLPFFSFFAAQEGYIAARGRSGGLALWVKK
ncbi:hypothetical protein PGN35_006030 [Nodosilinea sp. PGN35]|uniref:hypothetical protein n=1 Tax=Nodosilinea sp. PGN35 TaxID=3020489 RepID=UPI0023B32297|nr:hypothetical protein [Nodosilinea sp. TSF1-S3]MDF0367775.1 hypothetical protein [Nodosilinea sp. TSF1-S3]